MSRSFDHLAAVYAGLERLAFGRALDRSRTDFLDTLAGCRRILLVGDGDGRFLQAVLRHHPTLTVISVDASPGMLARARRRLDQTQAARVTFRCEDIRRAEFPSGAVDAVVTQFVLDCFRPEELGPIMERLADTLRPAGRWIWSDFVQPPAGWRRRIARLILAILYAFFRATTGIQARQLPDVEHHWRRLGFRREAEVKGCGGFVASAWWVRPAVEGHGGR